MPKKTKILVCQRCGNKWKYKGRSNYFTSCSMCKTSVNVRQPQPMPDNAVAQKT